MNRSMNIPVSIKERKSSSKKKKKKKRKRCENELNNYLLDEIETLMITSRNKGAEKMAKCYYRAFLSIKDHTEPIINEEEAKKLKNIGTFVSGQIKSILIKKNKNMQTNETIEKSLNLKKINLNKNSKYVNDMYNFSSIDLNDICKIAKSPSEITHNDSNIIKKLDFSNLYNKETNNEIFYDDNDKWEVILLLDHREVIDRKNRSILELKLREKNICCEVRSLSLGDIMWIVRRYRKENGILQMKEFVLNIIIERKILSDLCSSIIDKRYIEQKSRLKKCGISYVIYLIEGIWSNKNNSIKHSDHLYQIISETQLKENFMVYQTKTVDETIDFLYKIHMDFIFQIPFNKRYFRETLSYDDKVIDDDILKSFKKLSFLSFPVKEYDEFAQEVSKKQVHTVGNIFQFMLKQIPGIGNIKAKIISEQYPTFSKFYEAFKRDEIYQDTFIKEIYNGTSKFRLIPRTSRILKDITNHKTYEGYNIND